MEKQRRWGAAVGPKDKALITANCAATSGIFTWRRQGTFTSNPQIHFKFLYGRPRLSPQPGFKLPLVLLLFKWQEANFRQKIFNSSKDSWNLFRATKGLSTGNHPLLSPKGIDGVLRDSDERRDFLFSCLLCWENVITRISEQTIDKTPSKLS